MGESTNRTSRVLQYIQETAKVGLWEVDLVNKCVYWSVKMFHMYSLEPGDHPVHLGELSRIDKKDSDEINKCMRQGIPYDLEMQVEVDNDKKWVRSIGVPVKDDGELIRVYGAIQDTNEKKEAEVEYRRSQQTFNLAVDAGVMGLWNWNIRESTLSWNSHMHDIFDWPEDKFTGVFYDFMDRIHEDDIEKVNEALEEAMTGSDEYRVNYRVIGNDRKIRYVTDKGKMIKNNINEPIMMVSVCQDMTEIRQSEERFKKVIESSPSAIIMARRDGTTDLANHEADRIFGYKSAEWGEIKIENLVPERFREGHPKNRYKYHKRPVQRTMSAGNRDLYAVSKDNKEIPVEINLKPVSIKGETLVMAHITDITPRKKAREQIESLNRSLEEKVKERTAKLEFINQELEAFSYSVSHDLGSLLRAIHGFSQALMEDYKDKIDEDEQYFLKRILAGTTHMGQLIDDLLELSSISRKELDVMEVNVSE